MDIPFISRVGASADSEFHARWRETLLNLLSFLVLISLCFVWS